ncbi:DUF485 domain-containing protein [Ralstonia soli]|uniref:DUF485 domain-containing protein n=1 Tax=Ralstonia soli TaxID=2953896 RepID=A0ABT1ALF7_9RALS|nr:DUF485 domain-containing protein [Ralstonia soli]MCO5399108.1 DUF485 domain-containing protein [Ralstonia soli]
MQEPTSTERIQRHPRFGDLVRRRSSLSRRLLVLVLAPYLALMLTVALQPQFLAQPLRHGTWLNLGIAISVGIVLLGWVATWFYVRRANGQLETIVQQILSEAAQ